VRARSLTGLSDSTRVRFAPAPSLLSLVGGNDQSVTVGSTLANPLAVRVLAADGLGVPGTAVRFRPLTTGGSVRDALVVSDDNGNAATTATLGTVAGLHQFEASVSDLPAAVFDATALAAAASAIAIVSGDNQSVLIGALLANPLVVRVTDQYGNGVQAATVDWLITSGSGLLGAASTVTGTTGTTQNTYTASLLPGIATVSATVRGVSPVASVSFTITIL
jgi:hypothetical protein